MKVRQELRSMIVVLLLLCAAAVALAAIACSGSGSKSPSSSETTFPSGATAGTEETGTTVAAADPLSSFESKDPFIPQAQLTTTTVAATTTVSVTTTTVASTTTTAQHQLYVAAINPNSTVNYTVDGVAYTNQPVNARVTFSWGSIEVHAVDIVSSPNTVTFWRNGSIVIGPLKVGDTAHW